jgi:hypothetical protein
VYSYFCCCRAGCLHSKQTLREPGTFRDPSGALVSGVQVVAVNRGTTAHQAGEPLSVTGTASIPGVGGVYVDRVSGTPLQLANCGNLNPRRSNNRLLNAAAFGEPAPFTFGTTRQLQTIGQCGTAEEDISLDKSITITEKTRFHIVMLFINAFNRHYWTGIDSSIADPGFGTVSGATNPRTLQYYGRFEF